MLLGEILTARYAVSQGDLEKALQFQARYGGLLGSILINMGIISEETLVAALSEQLDVKTYKDIEREEITFKDLGLERDLNVQFLLQRRWLPLRAADGTVFFAATNPCEYEVIQYLQNEGFPWEVYLVTESQFRDLQSEYEIARGAGEIDSLAVSDMLESEIDKLRELASEAPVVNLVNALMSKAIGRGASDLHLEPYKNMYRVRLRIDGILHDIDFLPLKMQLPVASRIKILAGLDIAERRRPQDGQISMKVSSRDIDVRVSTLPLAEGESLVLRFLVQESIRYDLAHLGLEPDLIEALSEDISRSAGVILLTGPTGSGKTTTLYSCLNKVNSDQKKIITIEDPVEYHLEGINQIQVRPDIGYDFLSALRSIVRQDPDVIMIGEIRDGDTARVAMRSSLTGHLVFSTVHTNDAATAYTRLIDLGVEEYLMNASLISVIAQRLVRKVCPDCAVRATLNGDTLKSYDLDLLAEKFRVETMNIKQAKGCPSCNHTGYRGRVGIMEYLRCTQEIKHMPKNNLFFSQVRQYMSGNNVRTLAEDGFLKVLKGVTTVDEVMRVAG
jgi:general secretion pathway protein E